MDGDKRNRIGPAAVRGFQVHPKVFVFFDRATGTQRFEVKAGPDGHLPEDQAVSMLAMQCLVRGKTPKDFRLMVATGEDMLDGLVPRAKKLIQACLATAMPVHLSSRQQEVLRELLQNHSNKEIASQLNVSVTTVKFHVSALLQKFNVESRVDLMRRAPELLSPEKPPREIVLPGPSANEVRAPGLEGAALHPKLLRLTGSERRAR